VVASIRVAVGRANFLLQAIQIYERKQSVHKRGNVEFVTGSLDKMKEFNVHKDLEVYKVSSVQTFQMSLAIVWILFEVTVKTNTREVVEFCFRNL